MAESALEEIDALLALTRGEPCEGFPDQRLETERYLFHEAASMQRLVEAHRERILLGLHRWNGHGAVMARHRAVRDRVRRELERARRLLPGARRHDAQRYDLAHVWENLELRFGAIRREGTATAGDWADPDDRKSTFTWSLRSARGPVLVRMPWTGVVELHHEGRRAGELPPASCPTDDAASVCKIASRWSSLERWLANPSWTPGSIPPPEMEEP